jgi:hypothetical protein
VIDASIVGLERGADTAVAPAKALSDDDELGCRWTQSGSILIKPTPNQLRKAGSVRF